MRPRDAAPDLSALDGVRAEILNRVLAGNVDEHGFVTNERRYLAIAQCAQERVRANLPATFRQLKPSMAAAVPAGVAVTAAAIRGSGLPSGLITGV
jgi:hypothetical protein